MSNKRLLVLPVFIWAASTLGYLHSQTENLTMSLDQLYEIAEQNNTSIRVFDTAVEEAKQSVAAAKAERLPDLDASLSVSYLGNGFITDRDFSNGTSVHIPHFGNNFALKAVWAIYTGGALTSGIDLARMGKELAAVNAEENRKRVRFAITGYYLQLHCLQNQVKVFEENIALTDSLLENIRNRYTQGMALQNDITRYELQSESLKLARTKALNKIEAVNRKLLTALGQEADVHILTADNFDVNTEIVSTEEYWQNEAALNSDVLRKSQIGIRMSDEKVRLEKSERLPKVALFAEDHLDGPITFEIPNLDNNIHYWFVGLSISYNLSSLYKNNKKINRARVASLHARESHRDAVENTQTAVQEAYRDYLTMIAELETSNKSLELANKNYDVIYSRYTNGLAIVTDMLDASNEKLNAELNLVNSRINAIYHYYNLKFISGTI
ncbi:MAG: TolC family protein [Muribaculaceae bacterium]